MKNKKALRIFSTSFLLGALLITQPSFAQIANDDVASNVGLEISDNNERSNVKASLADNVSDNFEIKNFNMTTSGSTTTNPASKLSFDIISKSNKPYKAGDYIEIEFKGASSLNYSSKVIQNGTQIATMIVSTPVLPRSKKDSSYVTGTGATRNIKVIFNENIVGRNDIKMYLNLEATPGSRYAIDEDEEEKGSVDYHYTFNIVGQNEIKSETNSRIVNTAYPFGNTYIYNDKNSDGGYKSSLVFTFENGGKKGSINKTDLKGEKFTAEIDNGFDLSSIKKGDIIDSYDSSIYDKDYVLNQPYHIKYDKLDSTGQLRVIDVIQGKGDEPSKVVVEVLNSIPVGKVYSYNINGLSYKKSVDFSTHNGGISNGKLLANDNTLWGYTKTTILNIVYNRKDNSASSTEQTVKNETKTEPINFERETRNNPNLAKGETKVIQKGVNGEKEITYKVTYKAGKEVKREKVSEKVIKKPVKEIIEVGTSSTQVKDVMETEIINFERETRNNPKLKKGETKVIQKGVTGFKEINYKVTYENGKEIKREKISEKVVVKPIKEIVEVGTLATTTKNETKTETVPFEKETRNNPKLKKGETKVVQKGVDGVKEITYKVTLENGKEIKREKISEKITKQPIKEITEVGTLETITKEEKKTETIKFEKETKENPKLKKGETKVVQKGVDGVKEITYKVTLENGKEIKREKVSEKITKEPIKEITEVGTLVSEVKEEKKTEDIKFKTIFKENPELKKDEKKVVTKGENGKLTVFYKVTYENGKEVKREKYYEEVSKEKVDEVIEVGTLVVETKDEEKSETVKFEKETKENPELKKGETKVIQKGEDGEKTVKYKVTYNNGVEVNREKISEKITKEPVKEITEVGTKVSETKEVKEVEDIKFETITRENKNAPKGEVKVVQKGIKGKKEITYKVVYENGKEVSREKVSETIVQDVLNEVIEVGTKEKDVKQTSKKEPKKETKQEKQTEKIEQAKKPESKNLPKAGVEAEAPLLAGSLLSVILGLFISLKKKFK